jgi:hypothetical protein
MMAAAVRSTGTWIMLAGLALMVAAVAWWLAYYGQHLGPFTLLNRKMACLMGEASECVAFRDFIGPSPMPVYSPIIWWAGLIVALIGLYVSRRNRVR